ncbi:MAG: VWA domain-containing protein [Planctomycetaceae bacterium]|nr:VWA domain-containing protein [Planctomycetaceae bacterium]
MLATQFNPMTTTNHRRGAMLVLVSALLVVLLAMCLFTVDVAYMQLTRSELRAATDAAAKAGAEALRRTKNENQARAAAKAMAAKNSIGGKPLALLDSEIQFGSTQLQADGSWQFSSGATPYTAVRVSTQMGGASANQPINLFFANAFGSGTFEPARTSTAAHTATEIVLCIDRSHSMCFDLSGVDWTYPPNTPMWPHPVAYPPRNGSRWFSLIKAVQEFANVTNSQNPKPRLSMVTWGSVITLFDYEGWLTGLTFPAVSLDVPLTTNHGQMMSSLMGRGQVPVLGGTDMAAGMNQAISVLTSPGIDPLATKVVVLMSDGQWNKGNNPVTVAQTAKNNKIIIHTVSFLSTANQSTMEQVAEITGGRFYTATNEAELEQAFREIARQLPVVLID